MDWYRHIHYPSVYGMLFDRFYLIWSSEVNHGNCAHITIHIIIKLRVRLKIRISRELYYWFIGNYNIVFSYFEGKLFKVPIRSGKFTRISRHCCCIEWVFPLRYGQISQPPL
jgi:hypothetical protein